MSLFKKQNSNYPPVGVLTSALVVALLFIICVHVDCDWCERAWVVAHFAAALAAFRGHQSI